MRKLALIGGVAGVVFSWWSAKSLVLLVHLDPMIKLKLDTSVLLFTLIVSVATGILFGIIPAWKFSRMDPRHGHSRRSSGAHTVSAALRSLITA